MASRNEVKLDLPDSSYHVYNRGVEYRQLFMDGYDYRRFMIQLRKLLENHSSVTLLAFCLMPNHFHLMLHQAEKGGMSSLMQSLGAGYTRYFNARYHRVGPLLQGKYKARIVIGDKDIMDTSAYIHLNPERAGLGWRQHDYSSVRAYITPAPADGFLDPWPVLQLFDYPSDYSRFLSTRLLRVPPKTRSR
jgi:REP element-mobilizing transposase RayT